MAGKCFVCAKETEEGKSLEAKDSALALQNIFGFPKSRANASFLQKFQKVLYCSTCFDRILNIQLCTQVGGKELEEREQLEQQLLLKDLVASCNDANRNQSPLGMLQQLRHEIVFATEIRKTVDIPESSKSQVDLEETQGLDQEDSSTTASVKVKNKKAQKKEESGKRNAQVENPNQRDDRKEANHTKKPSHKRQRMELDKDSRTLSSAELKSKETHQKTIGGSERKDLTRHSHSRSQNPENTNSALMECDNPNPTPQSDPQSSVNLVPNTCFGCGEIFLNQKAWQLHMEKEHVGETKYKCKFCDSGSQSPAVLRKHLNIYHPEKKVSKLARLIRVKKFDPCSPDSRGHLEPKLCPKCGKLLSSAEKLRNHMVTIHHKKNKKSIRCDLCNFTCISSARLLRHVASCHSTSRDFQCEVCNANFKLKGGLVEHMRIHSGVTPFKCKKCLAGFKTIQSLGKHEKAGHCLNKSKTTKMKKNKDKEPAAKTQIDMEIDPTADPLGQSQSDNENEPQPTGTKIQKSVPKPSQNASVAQVKYKCRFCTLDFHKPAMLKSHLVLFHPDAKVAKFSTMLRKKTDKAKPRSRASDYYQPKLCGLCGKLLSCAQTLKSHKLTMHPNPDENEKEELIKCTLCDFRCMAVDKLQRHIDSRHSNQRDFQCDVCKASFKLMYSLTEHMEIHSGSTPHHCKYCSAQFKNPTSCLNHELSGCCRGDNNDEEVEMNPEPLVDEQPLDPDSDEENDKDESLTKKKSNTAKRRHHARNSDYYQPKVCEKCGKQFKKTENYKIHMLTQHGNGETKFNCTFCGNDYSSPVGLRRHIGRCHPQEKNSEK